MQNVFITEESTALDVLALARWRSPRLTVPDTSAVDTENLCCKTGADRAHRRERTAHGERATGDHGRAVRRPVGGRQRRHLGRQPHRGRHRDHPARRYAAQGQDQRRGRHQRRPLGRGTQMDLRGTIGTSMRRRRPRRPHRDLRPHRRRYLHLQSDEARREHDGLGSQRNTASPRERRRGLLRRQPAPVDERRPQRDRRHAHARWAKSDTDYYQVPHLRQLVCRSAELLRHHRARHRGEGQGRRRARGVRRRYPAHGHRPGDRLPCTDDFFPLRG